MVEDYCEPIFSRAQLEELRRLAGEIGNSPPRRAASAHLLSGLVECACGARLYGAYNSVTTKAGRYRVAYYRCRRASQKGTCAAKQVPGPVVERVVIAELRRLALDGERVAALAGEAQATFEAGLRRLLARRAEATRASERIAARLDSLLELAEDRLITKAEYAARKARLEGERAAEETELSALGAEIASQSATAIDVGATVRGLRAWATSSTSWRRWSTGGGSSPPASTAWCCGRGRSSCTCPPTRCSRGPERPATCRTGRRKFPLSVILRPPEGLPAGPKTGKMGADSRAG